MTSTERSALVIRINEAEMYAAITELYNSGRFKMIAEDGTVVVLVDKGEPCDECGECIPDGKGTDGDGSTFNKHHAPSCSLYDPAKD